MLKISPLFVIWCSLLLYSVMGNEVVLKMEADSVVPDVIKTAPTEILQVSYAGGQKANLGNELTPTQVKDQPKVSWKADENSFYTLCLVDPDAPNRKNPSNGEWQHWLVGNIPGDDVSKGETLSEYVGSGPPKGSGLHRYVFLAYKQLAKINFKEPHLTNRSANGRAKFSIRKFAENYKLVGPVAGNFYQAQWDEYVPILYKQLGF